MGISSAGIGSGLDVNSLVSQLIELEKKPLNSLNSKKQSFDSQVSAFGRIKSDLDAFKTSVSSLQLDLGFAATKATSSDTNILTTSTSDSAVAGAYDIKISKLAQAGVKASADKTSASTPIGGNNLTNGGPATVNLSAGEKSFSITVAATDTLETLRDRINNSVVVDKDGKSSTQSLAKASIINTGTSAAPKYKLMVAATDKGTANDVTIDTSSDPALGSYLGFTSAQEAQNAKFKVNGLDIERSSNTVTDVIDGVTLNLADANETAPKSATLTIARDSEAITKKVNDFISAYNKLASTVSDLHKKGGTLEADNSATSIIYELQGVFNQPANIGGTSKWLSQIGISFDKNAKLSLNSDTFTKALDTDFSGAISLFTDSTNGFANRLFSTASDMLNAGGLVDTRISGINSRIKYLGSSIDRENNRLDNVEKRLRTQYSKLDASLGTMKNASSFLSSL